MKLYGVPLSQPFRAVAWTMLQLELPFEVQIAIPGLTSPKGTHHESFRALTPHQVTHVPLLMDGDLVVSESPAILMYLCERHQGTSSVSLYPSHSDAPVIKATIDSYLHWHHENTRRLATLFGSKIFPPHSNVTAPPDVEVERILKALDEGWLRVKGGGGLFVGGSEHPSIADILCYEELIPLTTCHLWNDLMVEGGDDDTTATAKKLYPRIQEWMSSMSQLAYHEQAHRALITLGDLSGTNHDDDATPMMSRLSDATKAGLEGLHEAQTSYRSIKLK